MNGQPRASELILNNDGSIYHLHLHPDQVADTVITVGDPGRVDMVSRYFDRIETRVHKREFITHTGYIGKKRLTVISTGIGPDNIDIVFNELHALRKYDLSTHEQLESIRPYTIVRFGTSGCIQADIPVGTLLMSEFALGIDNVLHFYQYSNTPEETALLEQFKLHCYFHHTIHPYVSSGHAELLHHFSSAFMKGVTLTAPGFYAPQGRAVNLPLSHPEFYSDIASFHWNGHRITNFEMETATMYGLAKLMNHRCLSLNVLLANRANGTFCTDPEAAVEELIKKGLEGIITL